TVMTRAFLFASTVLAAALFSPAFAQSAPAGAETAAPADIARSAADLPAPIAPRAPERIKVRLEAREMLGKIAEGASYRYWTFDNKVPGPMLRVRVGDTLEVTLHNAEDSMMMHSIDLHAVT